MGRRKIRHYDSDAYSLTPDECLFSFRCIPVPKIRPRFGKGSGRAGGARSATHNSDHIKRGRVHPGTTAENCPICRYGIKIWNLWQGGGKHEDLKYMWEPGSWGEYWEGNDEERKECEGVFEGYELAERTEFYESLQADLEDEGGMIIISEAGNRPSRLYGHNSTGEDVEI